MLVGRAFDARLREVIRSVEWVHSLTESFEPIVEVEEAPPASGRFPIAVRAENLETMEAA